ncbi:hypothetical protein Cmtc_17050 [Cupriavidus sp. TKC]|uniref:hypothetical protein n=1 Tax=Cupriavidus sp. TKC TaxID=2880159 RepID=UPI0025A6949A|nr:hypothetical protein [Cupriavidus sp. TKC]GMG90485.1 hypothetical protein Cmtc_17050 [Cupriavidus sp. TKC]
MIATDTTASLMTLGDMLDRYSHDIFGGSMTCEWRVRHCRSAAAALLETPLQKIDRLSIQAWRDCGQARGLAPNTLNTHVSLLRIALNFAENRKWIWQNPTRGMLALPAPLQEPPCELPPDFHSRIEKAIAKRNEWIRKRRDNKNDLAPVPRIP